MADADKLDNPVWSKPIYSVELFTQIVPSRQNPNCYPSSYNNY